MATRSIATVVLSLALSILSCGTPREIPEEATGIVTMAPHLTETVFALGQGHRVVGVSSYCDYPPEIETLPKLGAYLNPDVERLSLLRPELLIVAGKHEKLSNFARMRKIPLLNVHMDSIETINTGIATIARALDCVEAGERLRAKVRDELNGVRASVASFHRPTVFIVNSRQDHDLHTLFSSGGGSFLSELVEIAGGENIFADTSETYFEASKESVVVGAPEVILEFHSGDGISEDEVARYIADWQAMSSLPAVKNQRIYLFTDSIGTRPGPRVASTARMIAALLHPETKRQEP